MAQCLRSRERQPICSHLRIFEAEFDQKPTYREIEKIQTELGWDANQHEPCKYSCDKTDDNTFLMVWECYVEVGVTYGRICPLIPENLEMK